MCAEEYDERNRNSTTTTRGAIELKAHKTIVVRKQTRTISFDRVNHSLLSQFLSFFLSFFSETSAGTKWVALETQAFHYCSN